MSYSRHQVSLIIENEDTASLAEELKNQKQLRSVLVKFLDKYASNREQVEVWLNEDEIVDNGLAEKDEKLVKLKSSLAMYTSFLEVVKSQNESNVNDFSEQLDLAEFHKFKTNFVKSQQAIENQEFSNNDLTIGSSREDDHIKKEMDNLRKQVEEMKTLVSKTMNSISSQSFESKIQATDFNNDRSLASEETVQKSEEVIEEQAQDEVAISSSSNDSTEIDDVDADEALDILDSLM